ncbi:MAG TPA: hypothetical protein VFC18_07045 [Burkholderiales bacterium]|nr:hypothetical protein [Burkholderiales bacterium]
MELKGVSTEQQVYARWLDWSTRVALAVLIAAYVAYAVELVPPAVAVADLPRLWVMPVDAYLESTGAPSGWGWLGMLASGDYLNMVGVALLCLVTVLCYLRILPLLLGRSERLQATFAIAQVIVLLVAASGLLAGGH